MPDHTFQLQLLDAGSAGTTIDVFDQYDVTLDMLRPGNPWAFSLWRSTEGDTPQLAAQRRTAWAVLNRAVKAGGQVLFSIDGAPQLNGWIDQVQYLTDRGEGARIRLVGRDLAATSLDWDADPRVTLRDQHLEHVLAELFNRVGISVSVVTADAARLVRSRQRPGARSAASSRQQRRQRVDLTHARPGETVWQVAESILRKLGLMMWVAPCADGPNQLAVVVDVPKYDQPTLFRFERRNVEDAGGTVHPTSVDPASVAVSIASNVLSSTFDVNLAGVPTTVYTAGQAPRGDTLPSRHLVARTNSRLANDPRVASPLPPRPRFLHSTRANDPTTAEREADRVMSEAMANYRTYTCTVQGHGQRVGGQGLLYSLNTMAHVYDRIGGFTLLDEAMLITRVQFTGSRRGGQTTEVTLGTNGAITLTPATQ